MNGCLILGGFQEETQKATYSEVAFCRRTIVQRLLLREIVVNGISRRKRDTLETAGKPSANTNRVRVVHDKRRS
jgi:hypothetical protein